MIKRLVKMHFRPEETGNFIALFERQKEQIRAFDGCLYLELLQSEDDPCIFFTLSQWTGPEALERYRMSELFQTTWAATKQLFAARPEAWSTTSITILGADESDR